MSCMYVALGKTRLHDFFSLKFTDPEMVYCHPYEVLHCNYNVVITFDWRVLLTNASELVMHIACFFFNMCTNV